MRADVAFLKLSGIGILCSANTRSYPISVKISHGSERFFDDLNTSHVPISIFFSNYRR